MTQVHILWIHLSSLRNKIDYEVQIEAKQKSLKVKQQPPDSIKDKTDLLKSAKKDIRIIWKKYQSKRTILMEDQEEAYVASRSNMCPKKAARCFKKLKIASDIFSKLPAKKN